MFNCFGAEDQALVGSQYCLDHPKFPLEKTVCLINMDAVGCGDKLTDLEAENFPAYGNFLNQPTTNTSTASSKHLAFRTLLDRDWMRLGLC
jgi:Zn-dependent M28 family amino/carboxypeptidase